MRGLAGVLRSGERVLFEQHLHWSRYLWVAFRSLIILALAGVAADLAVFGMTWIVITMSSADALWLWAAWGITILVYGAAALEVVRSSVEAFSSRYFMTDQRVVVKKGLLKPCLNEAGLEWIAHLRPMPSRLGGFLGYEHLQIERSVPRGTMTLWFVGDSSEWTRVIETRAGRSLAPEDSLLADMATPAGVSSGGLRESSASAQFRGFLIVAGLAVIGVGGFLAYNDPAMQFYRLLDSLYEYASSGAPLPEQAISIYLQLLARSPYPWIGVTMAAGGLLWPRRATVMQVPGRKASGPTFECRYCYQAVPEGRSTCPHCGGFL